MNNFVKAKRLEIIIVAVIIVVAGVVYGLTRTAKAPATNTSTSSVPASDHVSYQGMDGRNALDLLKVFHKVDTKDTSFGPMIIGIDGVQPDSSHYWSFYVNGKMADVGADQYITKNGDLIEWKVESIQ
jgi:hypothetical protein